MSLKIQLFNSGPIDNNVILLFDDTTRHGIIFDPSFEPDQVLQSITQNQVTIDLILFTHGHFDHFAGLAYLLTRLNPSPKIGLHAADLQLWREGGGSVQFRIPIDTPPDPDMMLEHGQILRIGENTIEVRHTPGHSPGSVIYYIPSINTAVVGDLIFKQGVGRTDLDGGNFAVLRDSIEAQVFTLPALTTLIPGHGFNTTVSNEQKYNPFVGQRSDYL